MKKAELVEAIQDSLGGTKKEAEEALKAVTEAIVAGVKKDESVQILGFGTFKLTKRAARQGRNPQTGETIKIAASKSIGFKPASGVKDSL